MASATGWFQLFTLLGLQSVSSLAAWLEPSTTAEVGLSPLSPGLSGSGRYLIGCGDQCLCLRHVLACAGSEASERLPEVPTILGYNDTFFYLDFSGNSISTLHKRSWLTYSWTESLILKDNNLQNIRKDSFEGLLLLKHLDLSRNKIHTIEGHVFEPVPFLQSVNLAGNKLTTLINGTFEAWHGMQFLTILYLNHNPLSVFSDSSFFQLASLKYLDIGGTKVAIQTIQNVMMTSLSLEKLILPYSLACCLCESEKKVESLCNTIKLLCEPACDMGSPLCKATDISPATDDEFLKNLQSRRINASLILYIEPEQLLLRNNEDSVMDLYSKEHRPIVQVNFNEEVNLLGGINYLFPKDMPDDKKAKIFAARNLALIRLAGFHSKNYSEGYQADMPSLVSKSFYLHWDDKNDFKKLSFLGRLLSSDFQGEPYSSTESQSRSPSGGNSRSAQMTACEGNGEDCQTAVLQGSRSMKITMKITQKTISKQWEGKVVKKGTWETGKGYTAQCFGKQCQIESMRSRQSENSKRKAAYRRHRRNVQMEVVALAPRKLAPPLFSDEKSNNESTEISSLLSLINNGSQVFFKFTTGSKDKDSPDTSVANESTLVTTVAHEVVKQKEGHPITEGSESTSAQPNNVMTSAEKVQKPNLLNDKLIQAMLANTGINITLNKSNVDYQNQNVSDLEWNKIILNKLLQSNNGEFLKNNKLGENAKLVRVLEGETLASSKVANKTNHKLKSDVKEVYNATAESEESENYLFELQLNAQLESLIPNKEVRALICHVIRILKMDCSKPSLKRVCAKLVSDTGLLMKLFSEKKNGTVASSWRIYINNSFAETKKDMIPGYGNKLVLAICVTVVIMIIIAGICVSEIFSQRSPSFQSDTHSTGPHQHGQQTPKESQQVSPIPEGVPDPLWLQELQKPLESVRRKNMAQPKNYKESSGEEEIFNRASLGAHATSAKQTRGKHRSKEDKQKHVNKHQR